MIDQVVSLVLDESNWLAASMSSAVLAVVVLLVRRRRSDIAGTRLVLAAMNLFFGVTIGAMAFGHLSAVTIELASGTLAGSVPVLYLIGIALALPSWSLIGHTRRILAPGDGHARGTLALNAWLAITLLALGLHNLPLAAPGLLNIAYHLHSRRVVGRVIVAAAVVVNAGLFLGSWVFLVSGQTFEQFRGME